MPMTFEDLRVLKAAEDIADDIWREVVQWDAFAKDVVGGQFARAADSVGANIAEAFGRYHYGEKLQFLYYARGSLFESKYWLNRAAARQLLPSKRAQEYATRFSETARQINAFAQMIKRNRSSKKSSATLKELSPVYITANDEPSPTIFDETELEWLETYLGPVPKSLFKNQGDNA